MISEQRFVGRLVVHQEVELRRFRVKKRGMNILSRDIQVCVGSSMDLVPDKYEVCHQAGARKQPEASSQSVFRAELRSLT